MAKYLKSKLTKMEQMAPEYFDQNLKLLNENNTVISEFMETHDCLTEEARKYLDDLCIKPKVECANPR